MVFEKTSGGAERDVELNERFPGPGFLKVLLHHPDTEPVGKTGRVHLVINDDQGNAGIHIFHTLTQDSWSVEILKKGSYATICIPVGKGFYLSDEESLNVSMKITYVRTS